jgi:GntR family transcriptional regulator
MTGGVGVQLGRIDRLDDRPPYRQIADQLRAAIDAGQLRPGDQLPSEAELKQHYGVARMTARQAIQELRSEGRVVAEHGRGVFVRQPPPVRRLASDRFARKHREAGKAAFLAEAEKSGFRPRVDQIEVARTEAPEAVRERLQLDDGPVLRRSRRYLADDRPVELAVSYLPLSIAEGTAITEIDTGPGGVYARLEDAGHTLDRFVEEVTARMPTAEERRRLELQEGVPVLVVLRTAYDTTSTPVEVCDTVKASPAFVLEYDIKAR